MNEFDVIKNFCAHQTVKRSDVIVGTGDDCAITEVPAGYQLAITTDTLVEGVHFPPTTAAFDLGYKSLAVNLSDLAAMGATPAWITFALTLPHVEKKWLDDLAQGFFELATRYNVQLIGGDLTHGPLSITLQAQGFTPKNQAIKRSGANTGDFIYVTNTLGDAGLALLSLNQKIEIDAHFQNHILTRFNRPEPRIAVGEKLRGIASAMIDISDGLAADLGHILQKSGTGATIYIEKLPLSDALRQSIDPETAIALALNAGDDYELCFTVPAAKNNLLAAALKETGCQYTCIGEITTAPELIFKLNNGNEYHGKKDGYRHF